jgi:hypothetical protein
VPVVWHDPGVIQRDVWLGTAIIIASVAFTLFVFYAVLVRRRLRGYARLLVCLGGWLVLFAVQLAYVSAHGAIVYGVYYNEATGEYEYAVAQNPMMAPVIAVTVATALVVISSVLVAHLYEVYGRVARRVYYVEVE